MEEIGIPRKLPENVTREEILDLVEKRLAIASKTVCDLNTWEITPQIASKMNFVVGELKDENDPQVFADSTWSNIIIKAHPGQDIVWETDGSKGKGKGKGDGTVPHWSSEPSALKLPGIYYFPHSSSNEHSALLDDAIVVSHLQRMFDKAAIDVAWLTNQPLGRQIINKSDWQEARDALLDTGAANTQTEIFAAAIKGLSEKANELGITGLEIYRDAKAYSNDDKVKEYAYKSVGYSIAATTATDLNSTTRFWAHQNSAFNWWNVGNTQMALALALDAGKKNRELTEIAPDEKSITLRQISENEKAWQSIIRSEKIKSLHPKIAEVLENSTNSTDTFLLEAEQIGYVGLAKTTQRLPAT